MGFDRDARSRHYNMQNGALRDFAPPISIYVITSRREYLHTEKICKKSHFAGNPQTCKVALDTESVRLLNQENHQVIGSKKSVEDFLLVHLL